MKRIQLLTVITALTAAVGAHAQVPSVTNYTFTTIDNPLGVKGTQLHGISGSNIVGNYYDASNGSHGFLYNGSTYTTIHPPSASLGTGMGGVSGDKIVGSYRDASNIAHGFVYSISTSAYTTFDHPLTIDLTAGTGICGTNIVGYFGYGHQGGEIGATGYNGFLYNGATFTTIDHPLGVNGTIALGIDGNDIVGYWGDAAGHNHGFLYNGPTFTTIDDPLGASDTIVNGISGNTIFGNYTDASGIPHGFVYSISTSAYTTFDRPLGVNGKGVAGISGDKIVGSYWDASGNAHGYLATPISDTATATATMANGFVVAATISAPGCLGSLLLPRLKLGGQHPLRVYGKLELGIGACGILVLFLMPLVDSVYTSAVGHGMPAILLRALVSGLCLLPPTFLMGASLPAASRWIKASPEGVGMLGLLYGANTVGAVMGCLLAGFYLLRVFDMATATYVAAAINATVGLASFSLAKRAPEHASAGDGAPKIAAGAWPVYLTIALSGATALGAEVVWTRNLGLMLGATVYTFSIRSEGRRV